MPGGDAAEGAARVAAAARDHGGDPVAEAAGDRAAPIGPGEPREIRRRPERRQGDLALAVAPGEAGEIRDRLSVAQGARELDDQVLRLVPAEAVELREVAQQLDGGEGAEVAAGGDVARVAALAQRQGEREEVERAPLKGERERDRERRLGGSEDRVERCGEIFLPVEGDDLRAEAGPLERAREVPQAEVLLDLGTHQGEPGHGERSEPSYDDPSRAFNQMEEARAVTGVTSGRVSPITYTLPGACYTVAHSRGGRAREAQRASQGRAHRSEAEKPPRPTRVRRRGEVTEALKDAYEP